MEVTGDVPSPNRLREATVLPSLSMSPAALAVHMPSSRKLEIYYLQDDSHNSLATKSFATDTL